MIPDDRIKLILSAGEGNRAALEALDTISPAALDSAMADARRSNDQTWLAKGKNMGRNKPPFMDLTRQRYGRLTVIREVERSPAGRRCWLCQCECGNMNTVQTSNLRSGEVRSCGCLHGHGHQTHGMSDSPEYKIWQKMIDRCVNPNNKDFSLYDGRGIKVSSEWQGSFESFYHHIGPRPSIVHSIDRIDTNGNYEIGNVRWADTKTQCRNRRNNHRIVFRGENLCISEWAERFHLKDRVVRDRLRLGWSIERSLTTPLCGSSSFGDTEDVITLRNREDAEGSQMACNDHDGLN